MDGLLFVVCLLFSSPGAMPCCGGEACVPLWPLELRQLECMLLVGATMLNWSTGEGPD